MRLSLFALALALVALPARADDDDSPRFQRMRFVERGTELEVTTTIGKLFDQAAYQALSSGFPSTVLISTAVYPRNGTDPVVVRLFRRSVVYDLWDENYIVKFEGPGSSNKPVKVKYQSEALKLLYRIDDLPISPLAKLPYRDVFVLRMAVQLNPVSKETLAEVRRWLSQGTGDGLDRGGVFFGNFVSVFVNPKIAEADRVLRLQSQPFFRPKP